MAGRITRLPTSAYAAVSVGALRELGGSSRKVVGHEKLPTDGPMRAGVGLHTANGMEPAKLRNVIFFVAQSTAHTGAFESQSGPAWPYVALLVARGGVALPCQSQFPNSTKALYSLLTGRYGSASLEVLESQLRRSNSLARVLEVRGYHIALINGQDLVYQGQRSQIHGMGYGQVYESAELVRLGMESGLDVESTGLGVNDDALMLLVEIDELTPDQPFLLTYYSTSSHFPYDFPGNPPGTDRERHQHAMRYSDQIVEQIMAKLEKRGLADSTLLVVTADHGETFFPDGRFRGRQGLIADSTHRVPLMIYAPGIDLRGAVPETARHVDIVPTVLDLLHISDDTFPTQGVSLIDRGHERPAYLHNYSTLAMSALVEGETIVVHSFATGETWRQPAGVDVTDAVQVVLPSDRASPVIERLQQFANYN